VKAHAVDVDVALHAGMLACPMPLGPGDV